MQLLEPLDAAMMTAGAAPIPYRGVRTTRMWLWRDVDTVDLDRHCRRITLPAGSGSEELWRTIGELHALRLNLSRPMGVFYLIDGLENGRFAALNTKQTVCTGTCSGRFGYVADRNAMPDIDDLLPLTEHCLADLESAVGEAS